jgi:predicted glycogen debranching enzyme
MIHSDDLIQTPAPGTSRVFFCGDTLRFTLTAGGGLRGSAWIRTNIGYAGITRREIIRNVDFKETPLGRDWFDTPMRRLDEKRFEARLALSEVGHFEAKCFFLKEGETSPIWPPGANTSINVEPASCCSANTIYNAFVRQFGAGKSGHPPDGAPYAESIRLLDSAGFTVIPPSGTFRDLIRELDFIVGGLGCRILMLLPIHPTPTTYARMGRFGSPYAALSFRGVDSALAVFDPKATPMEQFIELVDAVHQRNAMILLDIAINHTGWAANLHVNHPEWLARTPEGRIEVPGAWGVQWEDLTKLDYRHEGLWRFMAEVFLTWCRRGVDGFRCDAGYMIPFAAWKYIVARVREQFPDTVFLLEGLGGKIETSRRLLNEANLNWAYSELFQNYDRGQIERYLPAAIDISKTHGTMVHFAETHDNPRLAATSATYARMRTALCALASHHGAFGFANGVEWLATEKINVHEAPPLNWGAQPNQVAEIRRLTRLLALHPAFQDQAEVRLVEEGGGNQLVIFRHHTPSGRRLIAPVNLDPARGTQAAWNPQAVGLEQRSYSDLLTGNPVTVGADSGRYTVELAPGQVLCLSPEPSDLDLFEEPGAPVFAAPPRVERQRLRQKALQVFVHDHGSGDLGDFDPDRAAGLLAQDPAAFCAGVNPRGREDRVVRWQWPRDTRREVMLPPGHFLLVKADHEFRARLVLGDRTLAAEDSLRQADGTSFCLFAPLPAPQRLNALTLSLAVSSQNGTEHIEAPLMRLPHPEEARMRQVFGRAELCVQPLQFLTTNGHGGMLRMPVAWGHLTSRYDAVLAANMSAEHPEDRWIMFTGLRAWLVYQGYSQDINLDTLQAFALEGSRRARWRYKIPCGQGEHVLMTIRVEMTAGRNAVRILFARHPAASDPQRLSDAKPVRLILRPDIENRSFHETTKAYTGPEDHFRASVTAAAAGFTFQPDAWHRLRMDLPGGRFARDAEWRYMVFHSLEAERGLDPHSDLFSPGYFEADLTGGQAVSLAAEVENPQHPEPPARADSAQASRPLEPVGEGSIRTGEALREAMDHYVVRRASLKSVIAGYPWFLDWGRDSLIFARGLIAARRFEDARAVLTLFGQYEDRGTLPNMIRGSDTGNRDTSDAPLWFAAACAELVAAEGSDDFLAQDCGGRPVKGVIDSIVRAIIAGTPNGVRMDPDSALVFSPAHYTWMDTNYPAGSPRQGYPVEIQALWHAGLSFLARIDPPHAPRWRALARQVNHSMQELFWQPELGYLCDCRHAEPGQPARAATPDDALRPNQIFAIALGAVDSREQACSILSACQELLVPGAVRSLADRPVRHPLAIRLHGSLLNDPYRPYWGTYSGDEDTRRKPAYHNGTAWTWPFPSFCEAWAMIYDEEGRKTALALLTSSIRLLETGCVGHLPEILDGDAPHNPRGCDAQAWGVSEWVRVWTKLAG